MPLLTIVMTFADGEQTTVKINPKQSFHFNASHTNKDGKPITGLTVALLPQRQRRKPVRKKRTA